MLLSTDGSALRVQPGDRIGLVGRNGAGKTTTMRILAGEGEPYAGTVARTGEIGYLPQDPKEGNLDMMARDRVLSARGLDTLLADLEKQQALMAEVADDAARDRAVRRYGQLEHLRESRPARTCSDPTAAHTVRRPAPPGGAGPHPVRGNGRRARLRLIYYPFARRANQPSRR
jgi:ATPase subunit of ABC transporter with duplicated ATPase domains